LAENEDYPFVEYELLAAILITIKGSTESGISCQRHTCQILACVMLFPFGKSFSKESFLEPMGI
jgi:hypothetical protein